jgi:tetratricopeptide (TPR) repeat protein
MTAPPGIATIRQQLQALPVDAPADARTRLLIQLAMECARAGLSREGLDVVKEASRLAQQHGLDLEYAEAMSAASLCHYFRGDHMMAIASGLDAYQGFAARNEWAKMGHALTPIAAACREIDAPDLSVSALEGCLTIAAKLGDRFLEARTRNTMGVVLGDIGRFDEAESHFHASRGCLLETDQKSYVPKVIANLGSLNRKRADAALSQGDGAAVMPLLRQGIELLQQGLDADEIGGNAYEAADKLCTMGELHLLLEEPERARDFANRARELGRLLKHQQIAVESSLVLGRISMAEGKWEAAEKELRGALETARAAEIRPLQIEGHKRLAECFLAMGRVRDAAAQAALENEMRTTVERANREAQREVRMLWNDYFSRHPLMDAVTG